MPSLKAKGLSQPSALYKNWDVQASLGGPIIKDKLWFFANYRDFGEHDDILGMWGNLNAGNPNSWTYKADPNLKARNAVAATVTAARLTAQVTPRNKVGFFFDNQLQCNGSAMTQDANNNCRGRGTNWVASGTTSVSPEAASGAQGTVAGAFGYADSFQRVVQGTWSSPLTSHLLLEAGISTYISQWGWMEPPGAITNLNQVQEQAAMSGVFADGTPWATPAGLTYRALDWNFNNMQNPTTWRASASYVTGAHNMKFGYVAAYNRTDGQNHYNDDARQLPLPERRAEPADHEPGRVPDHGPQPVSRLLRAGSVDGQTTDPAGRDSVRPRVELVAGRAGRRRGPICSDPRPSTFPYTEGVSGFNDITPRMGAAYDLRQRQDVAQGQPRQVPAARQQPGPLHADEPGWGDALRPHDEPDLERPGRPGEQRRLHPAMQHDEPGGQRRMRSVAAAGLRAGPLGGPDQPGNPLWVGRPAVGLAVRRLRAARSGAAHVGGSRLLSPLVSGLHCHRQPGVDSG